MLSYAKNLTKEYKDLTEEQFLSIPENLKIEENQSVISIFNFINFVWFFSILGVVFFATLFFRQLFVTLVGLLWTGILFIWQTTKIFREPCAYLISEYFIILGQKSARGEMAGLMIVLTGLVLMICSFLYSSKLHLTPSNKGKELYLTILYSWYLTIVVPNAIMAQSELLGYVAVVSFYSLL